MIQVPEWFIIIVCFMLFFQSAFLCWLAWQFQIAQDLISQETKRKVAHTELFEDLTDQDKILSEMEASALASEALRAKRNRNVRDDAGPHAVIHKPPLRSAQPRSDREKFFKNLAAEVDTYEKDD